MWYNQRTIRRRKDEVYIKGRFKQEEEKDARVQEENEHASWQGSFKQAQKKRPAQTYGMTGSDGQFAKKDRLVKTKDFARVYRSGSSFSGGPFVLKTLFNDLDHNRIGFSISARSVKSAVKRNRIKRLFRESFRKNKVIFKKGFDMVLVVKKETLPEFSYDEAKNIFLQLAKKAGILA